MNDKKLSLIIEQAFDSTKDSSETWSDQLIESFRPVEAFYRRTLRDINLSSKEARQEYKDNLGGFVKALAEDVLEHLEKGEYPAVFQEYSQFEKFVLLMQALKIKKSIKKELFSIKKNVLPTLKKLRKTAEKKVVSFPLKIAHLPVGVHRMKSVKDGCEFYLTIKISIEEGNTQVRYILKGLPLAAGQWEEASADVHPAIKRFVEKEILEKKYQHDYLILS